MNRVCSECGEGFTGKVRRGRCEPCYRRLLTELKEAGKFEPIQPSSRTPRRKARPKLSAAERALTRVTPGWGGCWIFTGRISPKGYALIKAAGAMRSAHRVVYEAQVGLIPDGLELDHLCHSTDSACPGGRTCRHRRCINPAHLEPVTGRENNARGLSPSAVNARKQYCIRGHEFTPENTRLRQSRRPGRGLERACRACHRDWRRRRQTAQ
jgi:hypothetical protein